MTVLFSSLRARFYSTVRNEAIPVSNIRLTLLVDVSINTQGDYNDRQEATHLALYRRYIRIPYARFSNFFSLLSKTFKRTLDQIFLFPPSPVCRDYCYSRRGEQQDYEKPSDDLLFSFFFFNFTLGVNIPSFISFDA